MGRDRGRCAHGEAGDYWEDELMDAGLISALGDVGQH